METFSNDTPLPSEHLTGLRDSSEHNTFSPSLDLAPHPGLWHTPTDSYESRFIARYSQADFPHINFARNHTTQGIATKLLYSDPTKVYPSPPSSSSSTSKATVPLPEEVVELAPCYSTHLVGVLDSPTVMRREDLASHKPLTPPPTMPLMTLDLPDADVNVAFDDQEAEEEEDQYEDDEPYFTSSGSSSALSTQLDLPLPPLSPPWDPPLPQGLTVAPALTFFSESEQFPYLWSPYVDSKPLLTSNDIPPLAPQEPSSLLELDPPRPFLTPSSPPWHQAYDIHHEPPQSTTPYASLTTYDGLLLPTSPLISRLDLPELDDELPQIIPSSPSRRSYSFLPDSDIEMDNATGESAPASPGRQLLSLPGADTDDDLVPAPPVQPHTFVPFPPSQPLLFIDDPRDVPLPRSPSPEDFDLCLSPEDITDPELARLFDLRKRSVAAERAARRLEALTDEIDLFTRAEAQKTRKRERERSKEVGALLRLKLGDDRVGMCPPPQPQEQSPEGDRQQSRQRRRGVIGSISQLVAQMVFRRNETSRPLAKRKTAMLPREYNRSSLSRTVAHDV
ncbi:hypothetical protein BU15DRAFT_62105 [Melanogaster broomeanus]|nr:hypothetical protein BU15DRAFT_62105 [Melanogaster broomeanus]